MHNEFTAVIERDGDWYIAYCPEVPGANGQGRTKEEAKQSLTEAIDELERDEVIQKALGPIYPEFLHLKRMEWNDYHRQVSAWEVERYLTML